MKKLYAICIQTYPDEDDMIDYSKGTKEPYEVKIYYKGRKYLVTKDFDKRYYKLPEKFSENEKN